MKTKIILLSIFLIFCIFFNKNSIAQNWQSDSLALVKIYNSTNGAGWKDNNGWLGPIGQWKGVVLSNINDNIRVTRLDLGFNNLVGKIPPEIGDLTALTHLNLFVNNLSGSIPESIGNLTKLQYLSLSGCGLQGNIPSSMGDLTELIRLDLSGNHLNGAIPSSIGNLGNLLILFLNNNEFSGDFPSQLANLHSLEILDIGENSFSGLIPSVLGDITSLKELHIGGNVNYQIPQFSGTLPESFTKLKNLEVLDASSNELCGEVPVDILSKMTSLKSLYLNGNQFGGYVSEEINKLTNLIILNLAGNTIEQLPAEMNLPNMEILEIYSNQLSSLPNLSQMGNLQTLSIGYNRLDFDDLLLASDYATYFHYDPQAQLNLVQSIKDGVVELIMEAGGTLTTYQWYYMNQKIEGATQKSYKTEPEKDLYLYHCRANNELFPDLTLIGWPSKGSPCLEFSVFEFCTEQEYWEKVEGKENQLATTGKITINDLLNFEGAITIDTVNLTAKAEGEFYISDIPLPGGNISKYTFSKGEYELKLLGEDGKITNFLNSKLDSLGELCGIELKLSSLQLVGGRNANGIKMDCKIGIPGIAGSCGETDETKSEIELNGLEFSTSGIALGGAKITDLGLILDGYCLKELALSYDSEKDILTSGAQVNLPFGEIGGGIKMEKGSLDSIAWHLEATKPPFVLGTTTIGIKGFYGHISNIVTPPYEIELGGIFTDVVVDNLYLLDVKGRTVWPTVFEVEGNGKFMKPPLSEKPYQINGGIKMTYDHPMQMFALGLTGKIGTPDEKTWLIDGNGEMKIYTKFSPPTGRIDGRKNNT